MNKYITKEMIDKLEQFGTCVRYEFFKDPDGFQICDRAKFKNIDLFISDKSFTYVTDEFRAYVHDWFLNEYNIDVTVDECTCNIWISDTR